MVKKILIGVLVFVVLIIGVLVAIPMFYSIDDLRPQIQANADKAVRGKVQLGKLSLSLFPKVKLKIEGVTLLAPAPFDQETLAKISEVSVEAPLSALLVAPTASFVLTGADFNLVSEGKKSNLSEFLPPAPGTPGAPPVTDQKAAAPVSQTLKGLPTWLVSRIDKARFKFELRNSHVTKRDLKAPKADKIDMSRLDVLLDNVGIDAPMNLKMSGETQVVMGAIAVEGPIGVDGTLTFKPVEKANRIDIDMNVALEQLEIKMAPLFHKAKGLPFGLSFKGTVLQGESTDVTLDPLNFKFANISAGGNVKLTNAADPEAAMVNAAFKVSNFDIAPFGNLVPMVRDYKLAGKVNVDIKAEGKTLEPKVDVAIQLMNVSGATPQLQKPLSDLNGEIRVVGTAKNPSVTIEPFSMKLGSSDLNVKVSTQGLENISAKIMVSSKKMDVDELLGLKPVAAADAPQSGAGKAAAPPALPLDESLNAMAPMVEENLKNPMLDKVRATIVADMKSIKALGAEYTNATFNMTYDNRKVKISKTSIGAYGGTAALDMNLDLTNPKAMGYSMNAGLNGVKVQEVTKANAPKWKDEITGVMKGDLTISGSGLRKEQLAQSLRGGVKGEIRDGKTSLPIVKIITEVIGGLPSIGGKKLELPKNQTGKKFDGEFKTCKLDTKIEGRKVILSELDIAYDTLNAGLGEMLFKSTGTITFDRQVELLGTAFVDPEKARIAELKGPSGKVELPLKLSGDLSNPKPDIGYTLGIIGPRVAKSALKNKLAPEAQKQVDQQIDKLKQKAPAPVQKGLDDLKKKFHF